MRGSRCAAAWAVGLALFGATAATAAAAEEEEPGEESAEVTQAINSFMAPRQSPGGAIAPGAFPSARQYASTVAPIDASSWSELGPYAYFPDDRRYLSQRSPPTRLGLRLQHGPHHEDRSGPRRHRLRRRRGRRRLEVDRRRAPAWTPLFDTLDTMAIGTLTVVPNTSRKGYTVYVGTGEPTINLDSYAGVGVLASTDGGASLHRVGGDELWARASSGSSRRPTRCSRRPATASTAPSDAAWKPILGDPELRDVANTGAHLMSDVAIRPGTAGQEIVAVRGWREGAATNGLYESKDGGEHFTALSPQGYVPADDQGRAAAYSADGDRLYAMVQTRRRSTRGAGQTILAGVYASRTGDVERPVEPDRLPRQARELRLGAEARRHRQGLPARRAGLVQPVHRRRPGRLRPRLHRAGGGLRDDQRRLELGRRVAVLEPHAELLLAEPVPRHLPEHDALRPARGDDRRRQGVRRQRRRRVLAPDEHAHRRRRLVAHNSRLGTLQYYYADSGARPGPTASSPCTGAACRTTARRS